MGVMAGSDLLEKILDNMNVPKTKARQVDNVDLNLTYKYDKKTNTYLRSSNAQQIIEYNEKEPLMDNITKTSFYPKGTLVKSKGIYNNVIMAAHDGEIPTVRKINDPSYTPLRFEQELMILDEGIITVGIKNESVFSLSTLVGKKPTKPDLADIGISGIATERKNLTADLRYFKCLSYANSGMEFLVDGAHLGSRKHLLMYVITSTQISKNFVSTFIFDEMLERDNQQEGLYQIEKYDYSKNIFLQDNHIYVNKEEDPLTKANK
jgi:hypothetical protein